MNDKTIVILTAANLEYKAVQARLSGITVETHPKGTRFEAGHLQNSDVQVALALAGRGNQPAAVITERAVSHFTPVAVVFVGVAGRLQPHLALGDVVVAYPVCAYHGATSEDDGTTARPRTWELSYRAYQIAAHVERDVDWGRQLPEGSEPRVHFGPVAAGEVALYSGASDVRCWLREHYNDALAVEMEAAGVAQAGHLNDGLPAIMVPGISDFADGTKSATDGEGRHGPGNAPWWWEILPPTSPVPAPMRCAASGSPPASTAPPSWLLLTRWLVTPGSCWPRSAPSSDP